MDKFFYCAKGGSWQIPMIIEMEYCLCENVPAENSIKIADRVYFKNLANKDKRIALTDKESQWFCYGLVLCAPYFLKDISKKNILFCLYEIQYSDCCIQDEAFADSAIQWVAKKFAIEMPKVIVSFRKEMGKYGKYSFDFKQFKENI